MRRLISISKAADILSVSNQTVRNYVKDGKLNPEKTEGGHTRYDQTEVETLAGLYTPDKTEDSIGNRVALYCRVSSHDQKKKGDLERQVGRVTTEAVKRKYNIVDVFEEVGSGMNDNRPKLKRLFNLVETKSIDIVLIEHKDRLSRFCLNYIVQYFNSYGVEVIWVNDSIGKTYEQELVDDILSLMASFSAKIYGRRSHKNKQKNGLD